MPHRCNYDGHEVACLEQPIDISDDDDDDEAVAEIVDQFVIQILNMYTEVVSGDDDDSVEAARGL